MLTEGLQASQSPARLILSGRNLSKIQECIDALKKHFPIVDYRPLKLNLSSQKDVRAAAAELLSWTDVPTIDIVVNNAGIMNLPERTINEDGIEMTFATNHIGHFLFTSLIMPKILTAAATNAKGATRIVNVSSLSPTWTTMRWSDMNFDTINKNLPQAEQPSYDMLRTWGTPDPENVAYAPIEAYNQSKVANVLFSIGANARLYEEYGILSLAVHPGVIVTELGRNASQETRNAIQKMMEGGRFTLKSLGAGAATTLVAALDPKLGKGEAKNGKRNYGVYLGDCQISEKATEGAESSEEAEKLWARSEELVGEKFAW